MAKSFISVEQVAASLHVSVREVVRMAEQRILPGRLVRGRWQFHDAEIWNWIEENLHSLAARREKDPHPPVAEDLLISHELLVGAIELDRPAKTKSSVLRELTDLAAAAYDHLDAASLLAALQERERVCTTALQDGVAVPHPARPIYGEGPVLAAIRTPQPIVFGQRDGGRTDLFFLICCPNQTDHLLFLGRLCRLLIDKDLQTRLREAETARAFHDAIEKAERRVCGSGGKR